MANLLENFLETWGLIVARRRARVLWGMALLAVIALPGAVYTLGHLDVNIFNQISDKLHRTRVLRELSEEFGGDILAAVVSIPDEEAKDARHKGELQAFGDMLAIELGKVGVEAADREEAPRTGPEADLEGPWLRQIECRAGQAVRKALVKMAESYPHAVLNLSDVEEMKRRLDPQAMQARMKTLRTELAAIDPQLQVERQRLLADPLGLGQLASDSLKRRLEGRGSGLATDEAGGYFISPDGTTLVVIARPVASAQNMDFNRALMRACQRAENRAITALRSREPKPALTTALKGDTYGEIASGEPQAPDLSVGFTGMHAVSVENEQSMHWDIIVTSGTSGIAVLLLFLLVFRKLRLSVLIALTMGLAVLVTLALNALIRGTMGVMGAAFPCILLGMGVDYGIHLFSTFHAYREEVKLDAERALALTLRRCGPGILAASATTMVAFFGISTTDFKGLAELGFLSGLGLFCSALLMLSFFPALLIASSKRGEKPVAAPIRRTTVIMGKLHRRRRYFWSGLGIGVATAIALFCLVKFGKDPGPDSLMGVRFDSELGNLRSLRIKAIPLRQRVADRFKQGFADLRVVMDGENEARAFAAAEEVSRRLQPRIEQKEISPGGSILDFVPSPGTQEAVLGALRELNLEERTGSFLKAVVGEFGEGAESHFDEFTKRMRDYAVTVKTANKLALSDVMGGPLGPLLTSFARVDDGTGGRVRLAAYFFPTRLDNTEAWYDELARTIEESPPPGSEVRVTAARLVGFELKTNLFRDMRWISIVVGVLVTVMLLIAFRSPRRLLLAAMPLVFGFLFVLAGVKVAHMLGWEFSLNYVNMMIFPVLLGSGIDYGVYMVYDAFSDRRPAIEAVVAETGRGVLLCGLTTLAGFGSMISGSYTGLISFGWTALLGYTGALFGALIVLPSLMSVMNVSGRGRKQSSGPTTAEQGSEKS